MMIVGSIFTIIFGLYKRLIYWIDQIVVSSIVLNIEVMAESAALNAQDSMQLNINDLRIAKAFLDRATTDPSYLNPNYIGNVAQAYEIYNNWPKNSTNTKSVSFFCDATYTDIS